MSEQDVETIRGGYDAFNRGDVGGVLAILDEDVEWIEPGGGKSPSGTFKGPQEVGDKVFAAVPENFDEFVCTPESFDDQGDAVVVSGRFTGKNKSGGEIDSRFTHTWKMKDGKVASLKNEVDEGWAAGWS